MDLGARTNDNYSLISSRMYGYQGRWIGAYNYIGYLLSAGPRMSDDSVSYVSPIDREYFVVKYSER